MDTLLKVKGTFACQNLHGALITSTFSYTLKKDAGGSWVNAGGGTKGQRDAKILAIEFAVLFVGIVAFVLFMNSL